MTDNHRPTKSEIFSAYNRLRAAARRNGDTKQIQRLNKALGILQSKDYYIGERALYIPSLFACGCKDWQYKNARNRAYSGPCKHMLAEHLLTLIAGYRAAHDVSNLVRQPAYA